jgi:hypothetical protein
MKCTKRLHKSLIPEECDLSELRHRYHNKMGLRKSKTLRVPIPCPPKACSDLCLPSELWSTILPLVDHNTNPYYPAQELRFWFACRTVSKYWNFVVCNVVDLSRFIEVQSIFTYSPLMLLKTFRFSKVKINLTQVPPSYLSSVTDLTCSSLSLPNISDLSTLTKITTLTIIGTGIPEETLGLMTNLRSLSIQHSDISSLNTLTNLEFLSISGEGPLAYSGISSLTNLTDLRSNNPQFFETGPGSCYMYSGMYSGEWLDGKCHGEGFFLYSLERGQYKGQWYHGEKHGYGVGTFKNGTKYEGNWHKGTPRGTGRCTYPNGDSYQGGWSNGYRDGYGTYFFADGQSIISIWKRNIPYIPVTFQNCEFLRRVADELPLRFPSENSPW